MRFVIVSETNARERNIYKLTLAGGALRGHTLGAPDIRCGACGRVITHSVGSQRLRDFVIRCTCGALNDVTQPLRR